MIFSQIFGFDFFQFFVQYYRAPLVAADKLKEEGEGGLEDADHEEGVQHPTRYEPFKGGQRAVENNFFLRYKKSSKFLNKSLKQI